MRITAAALALLVSAAAQAQPACPTKAPNSSGIALTISCDPCLAGQPVTFTLIPQASNPLCQPYWCYEGYTIQACDTVAWNFGDNSGVTTVTGSGSVTHTFAAGNGYYVTVEITNALGPTPFPRTFGALIGANPPTTLTIDAPAAIAEGSGALVVNLTRSGNLNAPTAASYQLTSYHGYKQRLAPALGNVAFAPAESQKILSFPLLNNDAIWTGTSSYHFEIASSDGTLLAGLQSSPYDPFERSGNIEILDDEPRPRFRVEDVAVREGAAGVTIASMRGTLDVPSGLGAAFSGTVTGIAPGSGDFYTPYGYANFTFPPGETSAIGTILVKGDIDPEPDETFTFAIAPSVQTDMPLIERGTATITILNDDIGFGQPSLWMDVGQSVTLPVDLGTPLPAGAAFHFVSDAPSLVAVTPSLSAGSSKGTVKIDALRGGDTILTGTVDTPGGRLSGDITIQIFQPSILVANPEVVRLRVGEEIALRVSFVPAQPAAAPIVVQPEKDGIVSIVNTISEVLAGGEAVVKLRGLALGKTSLVIYSPGQAKSTSVPVEVIPGLPRKRAARP
jgi:hypothetical protein